MQWQYRENWQPGSLATYSVAASSALSNIAPSQAVQTQMIIFDYKEKNLRWFKK